MTALHGRKVDVAQDLRITIDKDGKLKVNIYHGTYPSVEGKVNGQSVYNFAEHSFLLSHSETTNPKSLRFSLINLIKGKMYQEASDKANLVNRSKQAIYMNFGGFMAPPKDPKSYSNISW
jgi:hypothetical protein